MNVAEAVELARRSELYPGLILHGADRLQRIDDALELARVLLCERDPEVRPCGECKHCRRIALPETGSSVFHPDFFLVERDLRTATSVDAVKRMLRSAQLRPFEARGQVFVLADAETLAPAAADALLKNLEEPAVSAPRHFFLLAPSAVELLPTLRSRCLSIYLGTSALDLEGELAEHLARLTSAVELYAQSGSSVLLLAIARLLFQASAWDDARSPRPWSQSAWLVLQVVRKLPAESSATAGSSGSLRRGLLQVSEELLDGIEMRVRNVPPQRILEGILARGLAS